MSRSVQQASSSTSTSKSSTKYGKQALPHINAATDAVSGAYTRAQPDIANVTDALRTSFDNYSVTNPNMDAANGYVGDVLGGKYLNGNPYLTQMIADTGDSVADRINALFSRNGQTGSSRQIGELGKQLATAENNLRYADYGAERDRMASAVGQAAGLNSANNENLATEAKLGANLVGLPLDAAAQYAQTMGGLWGNILDTKGMQKNSGSVLGGIGSALSAAGSAASLFSDRALKVDVRKVGEEADGLGRYQWRYIWGGSVHEGVMADEVAAIRPWAMGPTRGGFDTVNYGAL